MNKRYGLYLSAVIIFLIICCTGCRSDSVPQQFDPSGYGKRVKINIKDYGSMEFGLLEKAAPSTVESFIRVAEEGFFDGKPVYTIIKDYCIICGSRDDDTGSGIIVDVQSDDPAYYPFRGALCVTDAKEGSISRSFTVIQTDKSFLDELRELLEYKKVTPAEYYKQAYGVAPDDDVLDLFDMYGGTPWLYGHCTVFGQLIGGEDVLDLIAGLPVEEGADFCPLQEVLIESVEVY